jgi:lipoprotein-anchoring transpeptidase ErfK/SrfK
LWTAILPFALSVRIASKFLGPQSMLARLLFLLGMSVSIAVIAPTAPSMAQATKEEQQVIKKKQAKAKQKTKSKQTAKSKADAKKKTAKKDVSKKKPAEEAEAEKPKGLFATLFGGPIKPKDDKKDAAKDAKKDVKTAKASVGKAKTDDAKTKKLPPLEPLPVKPVVLSEADMDVVQNGNNGELRSDNVQGGGIMASLFGAEDQMLSQTRALDAQLRNKQTKGKTFQVADQWKPQTVDFTGYPSGTIVIDTDNHFLYLVQGMGKARRYGIAVGKDGLKYKGNVTVGDKQEWPRWIPTKEMQEREPKKYGQYKDGMPGGGQNPLGARAIYLYLGKQDTHLRIHGTIAPQSIGTDASNGCFRMVNEHVIDLYRRVRLGTNVVVL